MFYILSIYLCSIIELMEEFCPGSKLELLMEFAFLGLLGDPPPLTNEGGLNFGIRIILLAVFGTLLSYAFLSSKFPGTGRGLSSKDPSSSSRRGVASPLRSPP